MTSPADFEAPGDPDGAEPSSANGHAPGRSGPEPEYAGALASAPAAPDAGDAGGELDGLVWRASYDRESVASYLAAVEAERVRLLEEIRFAEERAAIAHEQLRVNTTGREARLGALVLAARDEIDRIDREHRDAVDAIRAQAAEEAARLRDRAEVDAAAVREVAASLNALSAGEDTASTATLEASDAGGADDGVDGVEPIDALEANDAVDEVDEVDTVDDGAIAREQTRAG